jgi:hypothetical protein
MEDKKDLNTQSEKNAGISLLLVFAIAIALQVLINYLDISVTMNYLGMPTTILLLLLWIVFLSFDQEKDTRYQKILRTTTVVWFILFIIWLLLFLLISSYHYSI